MMIVRIYCKQKYKTKFQSIHFYLFRAKGFLKTNSLLYNLTLKLQLDTWIQLDAIYIWDQLF